MTTVRDLIRNGWHSACDDFVALRWFRYTHRGGDYRVLTLRAGEREIELTISPTGRSVQVFVDGEKVG